MKPVTQTIAGSCQYTSLSKSTIYNLINEGRLDVRKVGKRTLITTESLDKVLGLHRKEAA